MTPAGKDIPPRSRHTEGCALRGVDCRTNVMPLGVPLPTRIGPTPQEGRGLAGLARDLA